MANNILVTNCEQFIARIMVTESIDPLIELIESYKQQKYHTATFVELYLCLQKDLFSFSDMRKIAQNLIHVDKLLIELYCTLQPQLGVAIILESIIYEIQTGARILVPIVQCINSVALFICQPICINGYTIHKGLYESSVLAAKLLGAMWAPDTLVKHLADNCNDYCNNHCDLIHIAFDALSSTTFAPYNLVMQYQTCLLWYPQSVRVSSEYELGNKKCYPVNFKRKKSIKGDKIKSESEFEQFVQKIEREMYNSIVAQYAYPVSQ